MSEHLSDLELDLLRLGNGTAEFQSHLNDCAVCQSRREILFASASQFAEELNVDALVDKALQTAPPKRRARHWARPVVAASAAVALVAAAFVFAPDTTRIKGASDAVEVFLIGESGEPTKMPAAVPDKAQLSVRVNATSQRYVRLLWESKPKQIDALYPSKEASAWRIQKTTWLPHKITIEAGGGSEHLRAVVCADAVTHQQALAELNSPRRCEVQSVEVKTQ